MGPLRSSSAVESVIAIWDTGAPVLVRLPWDPQHRSRWRRRRRNPGGPGVAITNTCPDRRISSLTTPRSARGSEPAPSEPGRQRTPGPDNTQIYEGNSSSCARICARDGPGHAETTETCQVYGGQPQPIGRGHRDHRIQAETLETSVVLLMTQRSRVHLPLPLPGRPFHVFGRPNPQPRLPDRTRVVELGRDGATRVVELGRVEVISRPNYRRRVPVYPANDSHSPLSGRCQSAQPYTAAIEEDRRWLGRGGQRRPGHGWARIIPG
jgi:hypothetical protein